MTIRSNEPGKPWALRPRPSQVNPAHLERLAAAVPGASQGLTIVQLRRVAKVAGARKVLSAGGENAHPYFFADFDKRSVRNAAFVLQNKLGFEPRIELHFPDRTYSLIGPDAPAPGPLLQERLRAAGRSVSDITREIGLAEGSLEVLSSKAELSLDALVRLAEPASGSLRLFAVWDKVIIPVRITEGTPAAGASLLPAAPHLPRVKPYALIAALGLRRDQVIYQWPGSAPNAARMAIQNLQLGKNVPKLLQIFGFVSALAAPGATAEPELLVEFWLQGGRQRVPLAVHALTGVRADEIRELAGLTVPDLAQLSGLPVSTLEKAEKHLRGDADEDPPRDVSTKTLREIAAGLDGELKLLVKCPRGTYELTLPALAQRTADPAQAVDRFDEDPPTPDESTP